MQLAFFLLLALSAFQAAYGQRTAPADTVAKRYANGRISVSEVRSADGIRTLRLFAPNGKLVYEFEDSRMHVICSTQLFYHENGAVERAVTRCHPDGGIQSSETVTQFDSANRPTWRTHQHNERGYGTPSAPE